MLMTESTVILANGEFPTRRDALRLLSECTHLVCCDGALVALEASGIQRIPDAVVGDLDSLPPELARRYSMLLRRESDQETNDLQKAFRFCRSQGWLKPSSRLVILGAAGRRDDHAIANISLLFDFAGSAAGVQLWSDFGRFEALARGGTLPCTPGEQLSVFSRDPQLAVTSSGLRYPLKKLALRNWWNGTLNECLGESFTLDFPAEEQTALLLYRPWPGCAGKLAVLPDASRLRRLPWRNLHFCGCGGVGMAGLAQLCLDDGCHVSGSDAAESPQFLELQRQGARLRLGHSAEALPAETELLVYSAAVPPANPERQAALRRGIPQCSRGQFLARLAPHFGRVVAVSGTHGKTTTTAMLAHILRHCGMDTGFLVGGMVTGWRRFASPGDWSMLVTEVDESDRSQEMMLPDLTVILNVDGDHSWAMGGADALHGCFRTLAGHSLKLLLPEEAACKIPAAADIRFAAGAAQPLRFSARDVPAEAMPECCPGEHNRMDAAAAVAAAEQLGLPRTEAVAALASFPGVQRRLTLRWRSPDGQKLYFDDYAHHPTELEAGLKALAERYPNHRLAVFFQPHRPERILLYGDDFARLLEKYARDVFIVAPFLAWEDNLAAATPESIAAAANAIRPGCASVVASDPASIALRMKQLLTQHPTPTLLLTIGAGDIGKAAQAFLDSI